MVDGKSVEGCLLGLMLGDSLGLPYEGLSAGRVNKFMPEDLQQSLFFHCGMVSDDTEHALFVGQAAALYPDDVNKFQTQLSWYLRWWLLRLPAGIGMATGRSIIKLWLGFPASKSGVYSAGNGPAMRSPVLGVLFGHDKVKLKAYVRASTELTHSDIKAYIGSLAVACLSYQLSQNRESADARGNVLAFKTSFSQLTIDIPDHDLKEFNDLLGMITSAIEKGSQTVGLDYLIKELKLEKGVSGYIYHTVPVVLFLALKSEEGFLESLRSVILLGGDTDTTAAILGGILGGRITNWNHFSKQLNAVVDWPISKRSIKKQSRKIVLGASGEEVVGFPLIVGPVVFLRNLIFLTIVLGHGFRRLLPPY